MLYCQNATPETMLNHVLTLDRVGVLVEKDNFGEIVRLERASAVLMTYYRNNIQHLFVLPSLVASIVLHYEAIQKDLLLDAVRKIYPFLKGELFLHFNEEELNTQISDTFENCGILGKDSKAKQCIATSGEDLIAKLKGNPSFIFTLIHKFNKSDVEPIYPDHDIIIMSDEAHRSQYGLYADNMMKLLPTAARIGLQVHRYFHMTILQNVPLVAIYRSMI